MDDWSLLPRRPAARAPAPDNKRPLTQPPLTRAGPSWMTQDVCSEPPTSSSSSPRDAPRAATLQKWRATGRSRRRRSISPDRGRHSLVWFGCLLGISPPNLPGLRCLASARCRAVCITPEMPVAESEQGSRPSRSWLFESSGRHCRITPIWVTPACWPLRARGGHAVGADLMAAFSRQAATSRQHAT